ncbi:MAG: hypothetical protein AAFV30_11365, partial [Pseudomonadota bacterium]
QREIAGWQDYVASVRAFWQAHLELAVAAGRVLDVPQTRPLSIPGAPAQPTSPHSGHDMSMQHDDEDSHAGHDMPMQHEDTDGPHDGHDMPEHHDHGAKQ